MNMSSKNPYQETKCWNSRFSNLSFLRSIQLKRSCMYGALINDQIFKQDS